MTRSEMEARIAELDDELASMQTVVDHGGTNADIVKDLAIRQSALEAERDRLQALLEDPET